MEVNLENIINTISKPRFNRYINSTKNLEQAYQLYVWNINLSQQLILILNAWEISLRNKIDVHFTYSFGLNWHKDEGLNRVLDLNLKNQLKKSIKRQKILRKKEPTKDQVVADLSTSFWVNLLAGNKWQHLKFKHSTWFILLKENNFKSQKLHQSCKDTLDLRNRIAHHEPIYHLENLILIYIDTLQIIHCLCHETYIHVINNCQFKKTLNQKPTP